MEDKPRCAAYHSGLAVLLVKDRGAPSLDTFLLHPNAPIERIAPPEIPSDFSASDISAISLDHEFLYLAFKSPLKIGLWARTDLKLASTLICDEDREGYFCQINDIVIRNGHITAVSADGTVTEWRMDQIRKGIKGAIHPTYVFHGATKKMTWDATHTKPEDRIDSISRSQDLTRIAITDRVYCENAIYRGISGNWDSIPARREVVIDESFLRINEGCNIVALGKVPSGYNRPITPVFEMYPILQERPIKTLHPLGSTFRSIIGTFQDIIINETFIVYFGTKGVVKIDLSLDLEKQPNILDIRSTTSRYIPLNVGCWRTMENVL